MIALLGLICLLAIAVLLSEKRSAINFVHAGRTLALQIVIAVIALLTPFGVAILSALSGGVVTMVSYAAVGSGFIFGPLADASNGFIVAFQVLPVIIFIAAVLSVLFHLGVMSYVIRFIGGGIRFITGASRLEATTAAANIFVGMAEAPLTILPYLQKISRAQLFVVMALGLSSVSGTVMAAYAALGVRTDLLLTAAFMAPAGGLLYGRMLVPETGTAFDMGQEDAANVDEPVNPHRAENVIEAAANGALIGLQIMLSVIAVLIAFVAGIALLNGILGAVGGVFGMPHLSLEWIMGYVFAPFAFLMGVPWDEASQAGVYLGQKVVLNEFLAYANFAPNIDNFSMQGQVAITVALCGFANLGGLAILIASFGTLLPERKSEVSALGFKTVLAGTLSNFTSAAIVSLIFVIGGPG